MKLSKGPWPRTGRDCRNSALAPFAGPTRGRVVQEIPLPIQGAVVIHDDGRLLVSGDKCLVCLSPKGATLWKLTDLSRICSRGALSGLGRKFAHETTG